MTGDFSAQILPWFAVILIALASAAGLGVLTARSLFVVCARLAAMAALAAAALLALGYGDAALMLALLGASVAPVLVMAGVLLSARAAKPRVRGQPWLSFAAVVACVAAIVWSARDLAAAPRAIAAGGEHGLWLGVLAFVAVAGCAALLGYGERGVLERGGDA
jgi:hypothetical protein